MLFPPQMTSFDVLFDSMSDGAHPEAAGPRPAPRLFERLSPDILCDGKAPAPHIPSDAAYLETVSDPTQFASPSLDPEEIALELGLHPKMTADEVAWARRRFAVANHPDRVPNELRDIATLRMQAANSMLDEVLFRGGNRDRQGQDRHNP